MPESKEFEALSRQAFDEADSDKSGAVGFDEFLAWLRKDADLMRTLTYMEMKDLKMYVTICIYRTLWCPHLSQPNSQRPESDSEDSAEDIDVKPDEDLSAEVRERRVLFPALPKRAFAKGTHASLGSSSTPQWEKVVLQQTLMRKDPKRRCAFPQGNLRLSGGAFVLEREAGWRRGPD